MSPVMSGFASNDLQSNSPAERIGAAAKEFEAVLLEQMLKEARASSGLGEQEDQASSTLREIADQQFARVIAGQGGLGVTKVLLESLKKNPAAAEGADAGSGGNLKVTL
jgi:Rod binding domain-containing protein